MKKYNGYKNSGIEWVNAIPQHWQTKPLFTIFKKNQSKNTTLSENNVLSLSYGNIIKRDLSDNFGLIPESFNSYQIVQENDIILRLTDLQNDKRSLRVGLVKDKGIITSAYIGLLGSNSINSTYFYYLLHSYDLLKVFYNYGNGVRQTMSFDDLRRLPLVIPPLYEQNSIAKFLVYKTSQIDKLIIDKGRLIELLNEELNGIINSAVMKGLDSNVPLKNSGIDWLGDVPKHWQIKKLKYIAYLKSGDTITSDVITESGLYPVYGGNGLRGYYERHNLDGNYVLIGRQGALCGNINYAQGRFWASEHAIVCHLNPENDWIWLGNLLKAMDLNQYSQSAAQPGLAVERIKNLHVPVPPYREQTLIKKHILEESERIQTLLNQASKEIELLKEYKTALISEVVTGKVDVRNEVIPETGTLSLAS